MKPKGTGFFESLELLHKPDVVAMLKSGEIKPKEIKPDIEMELALKKYREKSEGLCPQDRSRIWKHKEFEGLRLWLNFIDEVNRENASGYYFLKQEEERAQGEEKELLKKAISRWTEYIRRNAEYCRELSVLVHSSYFGMLYN